MVHPCSLCSVFPIPCPGSCRQCHLLPLRPPLMEPISPVDSPANGGERARQQDADIPQLMLVGCRYLKKKASGRKQSVQKKAPGRTSLKFNRGCFDAFLPWRKEKHFLLG